MKKYLAMLCATMLCVCCLGLAACGGSSSSAAASGSASASASASAASASASSASAEASFAGAWKLAAVESQGITMAGDLSAILGENSMTITIKDDGTGTMDFSGESTPIKWVEKDAKTITITPETAADASGSSASASADSSALSSADLTLENGALTMDMSSSGFDGKAIFTTDGVYSDAKVISADKSTPITSEDALVGTWTLSGMNMMGISMYGDAKDLSAMAGDTDTTITFEKDGKVTLMGSETTYTVGADGAAIVEGETKIPVVALDDDIAIDMTALVGMDMIMVFSK